MNPLPAAAENFIVIDYVVDGPRTAASVVRGQTRLLGMVLVGSDGRAELVTDNLAGRLHTLAGVHRVYFDAVFGRMLEQEFGLPLAINYDDVKIMGRLLTDDSFNSLAGRCGPKAAATTQTGSRLSTSPEPTAAEASMDRAMQIWSAVKVYNLPGRIAAEQLGVVYHDIELPVLDTTTQMIRNGVPFDLSMLQGIEASRAAQVEIARLQLNEVAGREVNPDSHDDLASFLYQEAGLPVTAWSETGLPSTSKQALATLESQHSAPGLILAYRSHKQVCNAARQLLSKYHPNTGSVHPELDPLGAATGRFACSHPNLQGLPKAILQAAKARPGNVLIEADFSQIELRILAELTRDPGLLHAFCAADVDIHRRTAATVLGLQEHQVTAEQRNVFGKAINFGIIYGETAYGLAEKLCVTPNEAQYLIDAFFREHPAVAAWITCVQQQAIHYGFVTTPCGRRRRLPEIGSSDSGSHRHALRQAVNSVIQGGAADLNKLALIRLCQALPADCRLLLTVHDSVLVEAPLQHAHDATVLIRQTLEIAPPGFIVPLVVDVHVGATWADCKT